nr:protein eyes shut homolog isoform X2 [Equus asinus]
MPSYGLLCEISRKKCDSSPCLQNTTPTEFTDKVERICPPGFIGTRSETDADETASQPCKNGATCADQPGNYFCQRVAPLKVADGFSCLCSAACVGLRCAQDIDDCILNACEHSSACKDLHLLCLQFASSRPGHSVALSSVQHCFVNY